MAIGGFILAQHFQAEVLSVVGLATNPFAVDEGLGGRFHIVRGHLGIRLITGF